MRNDTHQNLIVKFQMEEIKSRDIAEINIVDLIVRKTTITCRLQTFIWLNNSYLFEVSAYPIITIVKSRMFQEFLR